MVVMVGGGELVLVFQSASGLLLDTGVYGGRVGLLTCFRLVHPSIFTRTASIKILILLSHTNPHLPKPLLTSKHPPNIAATRILYFYILRNFCRNTSLTRHLPFRPLNSERCSSPSAVGLALRPPLSRVLCRLGSSGIHTDPPSHQLQPI